MIKILYIFMLFFFSISTSYASGNEYDDLLIYLKDEKAIASSYEKIIYETIHSINKSYNININKKYCDLCVNILIIKTRNIGEKSSVSASKYKNLKKIIPNNAIAFQPNIIIIDDRLIAEILIEAINFSINGMQISRLYKENKIDEARNILMQGLYLSSGNSQIFNFITEDFNKLYDLSIKFSESLDQKLTKKELKSISSVSKDLGNGKIYDPNYGIKISAWNHAMLNLKEVKEERYQYIIGAFMIILSHEIYHLRNSMSKRYSFKLVDDLFSYWKNGKIREEEDRADKESIRIIKLYVNSQSDIGEESFYVKIYSIFSHINILINSLFIENFKNIRQIKPQDLLFKVLVKDCRKYPEQNDMPYYFMENIINITYDNPPILTDNEVKNIHDSFIKNKVKSTHEHHVNRISKYLKSIYSNKFINNSWVKNLYPLRENIIKLWSEDINDIRGMIDPRKYIKTPIKKSELLNRLKPLDLIWHDGSNCPRNTCMIAFIKKIEHFKTNAYIEIIYSEEYIKFVKIVFQKEKSPKFNNGEIILIFSIASIMKGYLSMSKNEMELLLSDYFDQRHKCSWSTAKGKKYLFRSINFTSFSFEYGEEKK